MTRKLLLPALLALALALPCAASAATIETRSVADQGQLSADLLPAGHGFLVSHLHYQLRSCEPGADGVSGCHWTLYARTNPRNERSCPAVEGTSVTGYTSTAFEHRQTEGLSLTLGSGYLIAPNRYQLPRQLLCWYVRIGTGHELRLTAHTLVTF